VTVGPEAISELKAGTVYHYRLVAINLVGSVRCPDYTFTTAAAEPLTTPPTIGSASAQFINEGSAIIEGEVNPEGLQTSYGFEIGMSTTYGTQIFGGEAGSSNEGVRLAFTLTGLQPGTTYAYRIVVRSGYGTAFGADQTFTTAGLPTLITQPPAPPLLAVPAIVFPAESAPLTSKPKPKPNAQKLAKALKACKKKPRSKRAVCERQARKRYAMARKKGARR
jgi:hypothetical protein